MPFALSKPRKPASWFIRVASLVLVVTCTGCAEAIRTGQVEWKRSDHFSRADRRQILELATAAGMTDVRTVSKAWHRPLELFDAVVESQKTVSDGRVTWSALRMCGAEDRSHCERLAAGAPLKASGGWTTTGEIVTQERRRITDGAWHMDVALGPGVAVEVAERIVLAFQHSAVVNRSKVPDGVVRFDWVRMDYPAFNSVAVLPDSANPGGYLVEMSGDGTGRVVSVRISGEQVEVYEMTFWEA